MNNEKKQLEITGNLVRPIVIGEVAFICEAGEIRRTSTVLSMDKSSQKTVRFETKNTKYLLHISSDMEASMP